MKRKLLAILLAAVMVLSLIPAAVAAGDYAITADSFIDVDGTIAILDYSGTVGGVTFTGIKATSVEYQPDFYFTEEAVGAIQAYASENGFNVLRVHAYAICGNNSFVINDSLWVGAEWAQKDFAISDISTDFRFFSGSETTVEAYLWFEFVDAGVVNALSFTGAGVGFENYSGTVGGKTFTGVKATSAEYQPTFFFTEQAVKDIKAYAEKNDANILRISVYADLFNNGFVINNSYYIGTSEWKTCEFVISDISSEMPFWSQSEGMTTVYLAFEFVDAGVINSFSFTGAGVGFENYSGTVGGKTFTGVKAISAEYQPTFYFKEQAVKDIKAYAEKNGFNLLRISVYADLFNNGFVINNSYYIGTSEWKTCEFAISDISSEMPFWSQSEGMTTVYLAFEFVDAGVINALSFTGAGVGFENYSGTVGGKTFTGVKAISAEYQPTFYFKEQAVKDIQAYAEKNGFDALRITAYANLYNNAFVINNACYIGAEWKDYVLAISDISAAIPFWSQSEGLTTIYLAFEFFTRPIVDAACFADPYWSDNADGSVSIGSAAYQPHFYFSQAGIDHIQAYAEANDVDMLRITGEYEGTNSLVLNNMLWIMQGSPAYLDIPIADLTTAFDIWSQSETTTLIKLRFEAYKAPLLNSTSFAGVGWGFTNVLNETVDGKTFEGVKGVSAEYQPTFYFTQKGIDTLKAYAAENGFNAVRLYAYADLYNNGFIANGIWCGKSWKAIDIPIADLTTSIPFWSQSEGLSTVYLTVELLNLPLVHAGSFDNRNDFDIENVFGCNIADKTIDGVKFTSIQYQPLFHFTASAVEEIKAAAEAAGVNALHVYAYAEVTNNCVLIGEDNWVEDDWVDFYIRMDELTTDYTFASLSEGETLLYLSFELAHAHNYVAVVKEATCLEGGYTTYTCSVCGDTYTGDYVDALGHNWNEGVVTLEPTETTMGEMLYTCLRCGATRTETIPELNHEHNFIADEVVTPTCTEDGYTLYLCRCGASYKDDFVPALGHDPVTDPAVAATCTASGLTEGSHCSRCETVLVAQSIIPALGHNYVSHAAQAPTCTEIGWNAYQTCSRCGDTNYTELPALGHSWDGGKITTPATATTDGVKTFTCTRCGETKTEKIPATGEKPNPFKDVKEGDFYYDAVLWAVNAQPQVTAGTSATTFEPNATCTRAQVVTFLWRAKGCPEPKSANNPFTDVKGGEYYYKAVLWAVENEITAGTSKTTFSPNAGCTRAQVVTFLWRTEGQPKPTSSANPFKDVKGGYYYDAVLWAVEKKITAGTSATTFSPDNTCTRGQIVTFLYRAVAD